jgi:hypothetical protein
MGSRYIDMLPQSEESIARNVAENLCDRRIEPLLVG